MAQFVNFNSVPAGARGGRLPRRLQERLRRRAEILHAAEEIFAKKGYYHASIEEIARIAEYGTGTVYLYFKDKEALYVELLEEKLRELLELSRREARREKQALLALRRVIEVRLEYYQKDRLFFQIYMRERMSWDWGNERRWGRVRKFYRDYLGVVMRVIRAGQEQHLFRNEDARQMALALTGMIVQLAWHWIGSSSQQPLTEQTDFVLNLFLQGARRRG